MRVRAPEAFSWQFSEHDDFGWQNDSDGGFSYLHVAPDIDSYTGIREDYSAGNSDDMLDPEWEDEYEYYGEDYDEGAVSETEKNENLVARVELGLPAHLLSFVFSSCGDTEQTRWPGPWNSRHELFLRTVRDAMCDALGAERASESASADIPRWCREIREFFGPRRFARKGKTLQPQWTEVAKLRVSAADMAKTLNSQSNYSTFW